MSHTHLQHAPEIYANFIRTVVQEGVFSPQEMAFGSGIVSDQRAKRIATGKEIDGRTPFLMTISGKGGWVEGPSFAARQPFRNITLLDHLMSVVRGALVLAEVDLRASGVNDDDLPARLVRIATVAFLHDADKMLQQSRQHLLTTQTIEEVRKRYHIDSFLALYNVTISNDEILAWVDGVEVTRSGRISTTGYTLNPQNRKDTAYVRIADRMDGLFLDTRKGVESALAELQAFPHFRTEAPKLSWSVMRLQVAHIPFLADIIQDALAQATQRTKGLPPLFQSHLDGELVVALPDNNLDTLLKGVRRALGRYFAGDARIHINNKLAINILDGGQSFEDVVNAIHNDPRTAGKCLPLTASFFANKPERYAEINSLFPSVPAATWPDLDKITGATITPWGDGQHKDHHSNGRYEQIVQAAAIAAVVFCAEPKDKKLAKQTLSSHQRYACLQALFPKHGIELPQWLIDHQDPRTQKTLMMFLAAQARRSDPFHFGAELDDLLEQWLVGTPDQAGIFARHDDVGTLLIEPAMRLIESRIHQEFWSADESQPYSCHFTAAPVGPKDEISSSSGVYGLKITAFSGRTGRPENPIKTGQKGTYLAPEIVAEHRIRTIINKSDRGSLPLLVSSPTTIGLFGALGTNQKMEAEEFSTYDVLRLEIKADRKNYYAQHKFQRLDRLARYEEMPGTFEKQIDFIIRMLKLARRTGRPVHVFRGAPVPTPEFVYIDSLPQAFRTLFGDRNGWRVEEIPEAIKRCELIQAIATTNGLGVDLAKGIMNPKTRLGAACLALVLLERQSSASDNAALYTALFTMAKDTLAMNTHSSPIVRFSKAMTYYQKAPIRDDSNAVKDLGFSEALAAVQAATKAGMHDTQTLIDAVVAAITVRMERSSNKHYASKEVREHKDLNESLQTAARIFVEEVWEDTLKKRYPDTQTRQTLSGIYRVAFARIHDERRAQRVVITT